MSDHYTYRITWSAEDDEHVGLCAELPSLSWLAPTPGEALTGIRRVVRECVADMRTTGEAPPKPIATRFRDTAASSWYGYPRRRTEPLHYRPRSRV